MLRKLRAMLCMFAMLGLIATACSSSGQSAGSAGSDGPAETRVAVDGGTATLVGFVDPPGLDPSNVINAPSGGGNVITALFDTLYVIDPATGDLQPRIATSFDSPDGLTWTMKLRPGVTFSDGTPFNAEAVRLEWERSMANPRSTGFPVLKFFVDSMAAPDDATFVVTLKTPSRYFPEVVPGTNLTWVPSPTARASEGDGFANNPVGAGPFVLKSRTPGAETTLEKNPNYWQAGLPKLDTVVFKTISDPQQATDTLTSGGADAVSGMPDQFAAGVEDQGYSLVDARQVAGAGWLFNDAKPPFDDIRARKAVYYALDMEQLSQQVANGTSTVPEGLFPEGTPYYDPAASFPGPDPDEAQRLLDELAGEGKPLSFAITDAGGNGHTQALAVQTQLLAYDNISVTSRTLDASTYGQTMFTGDFQMGIWALAGQTPDHTIQQMDTGWPIKIMSMKSPEVDGALKAEREAPTFEQRRAALTELSQSLNDLFRMKWMFVNHFWTAMSPEVTGLAPYGQGSLLMENFGRVG